MHPILDRTLDLLFPSVCVTCGEDLARGARAFCGACWSGMPRGFDPRLPPGAPVDAFSAAGAFEGPLRAAIHALKYGCKSYVAGRLGELIAARCPERVLSADLLIPVPSPWWREIRRGFNPATLLALALGERWNLPVRQDILRRCARRSQIGLSRKQRWDNAARAYALRKRIDLTGRSVCVVDDVCTSGATIAACARILRELGARAVTAVVAAREGGMP